MAAPKATTRPYALLATAAIGFSGLAGLPTAHAVDGTVADTASTAPATTGKTASQATLTWSLKDSFLTYLQGPLAQGKVAVSGDGLSYQNQTFSWTGASGEFSGNRGAISYPGSLHFTGHQGKLDLHFSNITLVINGNQGMLTADVKSKGYNGTPDYSATRATIATVDLTGLKITDTSISLDQAKVTLSAAGSQAFAGFYEEGTELAPLSFSAQLADKAPQAPAPSQEVSNAAGTITWGIKDSFLGYLFTQDKAVQPGPSTSIEGNNFVFAEATATITERGYSISAPGSFSLYAHRGVMDIKLGGFRIDIVDGKGYLYATGTSANIGSIEDEAIATFDASGATSTDGSLVLSGATTTATANASKIFGPRYPEGTELDPIYFNLALPQVADEDEQTPAPADPTPAPVDPAPEPTDPSPAPADPSPADPSPEAPKPVQESTSNRAIISGQASWALKESFLAYLKGPIAQGGVAVSGEGITFSGSSFDWDKATGQFDPATGTGDIYLPGSIRAYGHKGELDTNLSNLRLHISKDSQGTYTGTLYLDAKAKGYNGAPNVDARNIPFATLDLANLKVDGNTLSLDKASAKLTQEGAYTFSGFYTAGTVLAPLSFSVTLGEPTAKKEEHNPIGTDGTPDQAKDEQKSAPTDQATPFVYQNCAAVREAGIKVLNKGDYGYGPSLDSDGDGKACEQDPTYSNAPSTNPANANPQCVPVTVSETVTGAASTQATGTVSAANLTWGIRSSFRNYIGGGIAKGSWTLDATSYQNSAFTWSQGSGTYQNGNGSISFTGGVHFTGHQGTLDTRFQNPRLAISNNVGTLYLTATSNDPNGKPKNYGEIAFATVDLASLSTSNGVISVKDASVTLTEVGAETFGGFYKAGEALDPISFSGTLDSKTVPGEAKVIQKTQYVSQNGANCDKLNQQAASKGSSLAKTGSQAGLYTASGLVLLLAGAAGIALARRRQA